MIAIGSPGAEARRVLGERMFNFNPETVRSAALEDEAFRLSIRHWTADIVFRLGDESYVLELKGGELHDFRRDDSAPDGDATICGPADSWAKLLEAVPPPGFIDPFFVAGKAGFEVKGDPVATTPYYFALQEFFRVLRSVRSGPIGVETMPRVDRDFDAAVGRYMYVDIQGVQYRIYYEEAGHGDVPLLLQHTAGSDGRQWRHMLEDPDYQKLCRMISYDLPYHGRSLPPTTEKWWEKPYKLRKSFLMDAVIAISKKLGLDRPAFMGCSVGGMLAPELAYHCPHEFRAVIAMNGALGTTGERQDVPAMITSPDIWTNPRIGNQWQVGLVQSQMSPVSPEVYRRETSWVYSQVQPTVNEGDTYYYHHDHDLTAEQAAQIDTAVVAVYVLTGSYDGLALDGGSARLAAAIPGSHYRIAPGLSHFGPAEDPERTKSALLPILQEITALQAVVSA